MNKPGMMAYKCQRCGAVFHNGTHAPEAYFAVFAVMYPDSPLGDAMAHRETAHECEDKTGIGLATFVGVDYDAPAMPEEVE